MSSDQVSQSRISTSTYNGTDSLAVENINQSNMEFRTTRTSSSGRIVALRRPSILYLFVMRSSIYSLLGLVSKLLV